MTKEELEQEAYEFLIQVTKKQELLYFGGRLEKIVADFTEPREERIATLEKELAEAKDIIEDLITKIPASLSVAISSEKERAEKFLGWLG